MANQETLEKTKKRDFIELEFTGRDALTGEIFDTNIPAEAKKLNPQANTKETKPMIVCIGEDMVVKGFDKELEGKETGKKYKVKLKPEDAFGKRMANLVKLIPKKIFTDNKMHPVAGMTVALDNMLAKIVSASGGRILVDLNNPLAGKDIEYEFEIKRLITDIKEKVNAIQKFFFHQEFPFDLDNEKKKIIFKDVNLMQILNIFKDRFKELTGYDVEIFAKPDTKGKLKPEAAKTNVFGAPENKKFSEETAGVLGKEEKIEKKDEKSEKPTN